MLNTIMRTGPAVYRRSIAALRERPPSGPTRSSADDGELWWWLCRAGQTREARQIDPVPGTADVLFLEIDVADPPVFSEVLEVRGAQVQAVYEGKRRARAKRADAG